ncbi:DMT family transporter [Moraxella marmotae]|uniref:DMT family transporter n=1 Tax=Moraxella marmotae TaxID=3344520 RepID=UPI0035F43A0B
MHKTSQTLPISGLLIGCVLFGMGSLIVAYVSLGAYAMAFWRLVVSSLIFVLLACVFRQKFPTSRPAMVFALLSGAALGLDLALWHESIYALGPGISTLLNSLQIFFLALIGFVFYQEKQSKIQLASLVLAVIGVGLIASPEFGHNAKAGFGLVAGIISGACLAISMTWIRQAHRQATVAILPLMSLVGIGGSLAMLPLMLWLDYDKLLPVSMTEVGWILVYGVVMQCLAWGVIAYSIPKLSLALTGLLLLTEPVAALVLDYFWLHKPINAMQWLGAALTMLAIYVGSVSRQTH